MSSWGENYIGNCQRPAGAQPLDWACGSDWEGQITEVECGQKCLPRTWAGGSLKLLCSGVGCSGKASQTPQTLVEMEREKECRAGRGRLAAEKTKPTEVCKFGLKDLKRAGESKRVGLDMCWQCWVRKPVKFLHARPAVSRCEGLLTPLKGPTTHPAFSSPVRKLWAQGQVQMPKGNNQLLHHPSY